jgi:hypothetical protein
MELENARSLAAFINMQSSRFSANVLAFGSQGWVIVADKLSNTFLEPIADAPDYVRRAQLGVLRIDADYCDLVRDWVTNN